MEFQKAVILIKQVAQRAKIAHLSPMGKCGLFSDQDKSLESK